MPVKNPEEYSEHPILRKKEFESKIPDHMLQDSPDDVKYMMHAQSVIDQKLDWLIDAAVDTNLQVRRTNGQVKQLREWRKDADEQLNKITSINSQVSATSNTEADQQKDIDEIKKWIQSREKQLEKDSKWMSDIEKIRMKFMGFWGVAIALLASVSTVLGIILLVLKILEKL